MNFRYNQFALGKAARYGDCDACVDDMIQQIRNLRNKKHPTDSEKEFYELLQKDETELRAGLMEYIKREATTIYKQLFPPDPPKLSDVKRKPFHHNF